MSTGGSESSNSISFRRFSSHVPCETECGRRDFSCQRSTLLARRWKTFEHGLLFAYVLFVSLEFFQKSKDLAVSLCVNITINHDNISERTVKAFQDPFASGTRRNTPLPRAIGVSKRKKAWIHATSGNGVPSSGFTLGSSRTLLI
jgi:hypothetical protein